MAKVCVTGASGKVAGFETLLSVDRARSLLGYEPRHTWRNHISDA